MPDGHVVIRGGIRVHKCEIDWCNGEWTLKHMRKRVEYGLNNDPDSPITRF